MAFLWSAETQMSIFLSTEKVFLEEGGWEAATLRPSHPVPASELGEGSVAEWVVYFFPSFWKAVL